MKEKNGEHPFGDSGQLVLLVLFLLIWVVDSFLLKISTVLSDDISLYIRLIKFKRDAKHGEMFRPLFHFKYSIPAHLG